MECSLQVRGCFEPEMVIDPNDHLQRIIHTLYIYMRMLLAFGKTKRDRRSILSESFYAPLCFNTLYFFEMI